MKTGNNFQIRGDFGASTAFIELTIAMACREFIRNPPLSKGRVANKRLCDSDSSSPSSDESEDVNMKIKKGKGISFDSKEGKPAKLQEVSRQKSNPNFSLAENPISMTDPSTYQSNFKSEINKSPQGKVPVWNDAGNLSEDSFGQGKRKAHGQSSIGEDERRGCQNLKNMEKYPDIKTSPKILDKCCKSSKYGDPEDPDVEEHYLVKGEQYPHPGTLREGKNTLLKRKKGKPLVKEKEEEDKKDQVSRFKSKALKPGRLRLREERQKCLRDEYEKIHIDNLGVIFLRKSKIHSKWNLPEGMVGAPTVKKKIKKPPIMIPSSGRPTTALLDLTDAMDGKEDYIEIIVVREEEQEEYLSVTSNHPALDVFVFASEYKTIGEAREKIKRLGERITEGTEMKFLFMLDDNILNWYGVTLINDPFPQFGKKPIEGESQIEPISLGSILEHFSENNFEGIKDFNLVGFSNSLHTNIKKRSEAYGCKHVQQAVMMNIPKSKGVEYNRIAWANEDLDFNRKTHKLSKENPDEGRIVKCMRYVACKKKINEGGVIPCDVPDHLLHLVQEHREWAGVKPRKGKKRSIDGMEQNRGRERGEKRKKNDVRKMSSIAVNPEKNETREEGKENPLSTRQHEFVHDGYTFKDYTCLLLHRLIATGQGEEMVLRRRHQLSPSLLSHTCRVSHLSKVRCALLCRDM